MPDMPAKRSSPKTRKSSQQDIADYWHGVNGERKGPRSSAAAMPT